MTDMDTEFELHWLLTLGLSEHASILYGHPNIKLHGSGVYRRVYRYNMEGHFAGSVGWNEKYED